MPRRRFGLPGRLSVRRPPNSSYTDVTADIEQGSHQASDVAERIAEAPLTAAATSPASAPSSHAPAAPVSSFPMRRVVLPAPSAVAAAANVISHAHDAVAQVQHIVSHPDVSTAAAKIQWFWRGQSRRIPTSTGTENAASELTKRGVGRRTRQQGHCDESAARVIQAYWHERARLPKRVALKSAALLRQGASNVATGSTAVATAVLSAPGSVQSAAVRGVYSLARGAVERRLMSYYEKSFKPTLCTLDYPPVVRDTLHAFADHLFDNLMQELLSLLETHAADGRQADDVDLHSVSSASSTPTQPVRPPPSPPPSPPSSEDGAARTIARAFIAHATRHRQAASQLLWSHGQLGPSPGRLGPSPGQLGRSQSRVQQSERAGQRAPSASREPRNARDGRCGWLCAWLCGWLWRLVPWLSTATTRATVTVRLNGASELFPADSDEAFLLSRKSPGGLLPPWLHLRSMHERQLYAVVRLGRHSFRSQSVAPTLHPEWDEAFEFRGPRCRATGHRRGVSIGQPLEIEIFYEDESLGVAALDASILEDLCTKGQEGGGSGRGEWDAASTAPLLGESTNAPFLGGEISRQYELPLAQGTVLIDVCIRDVAPPTAVEQLEWLAMSVAEYFYPLMAPLYAVLRELVALARCFLFDGVRELLSWPAKVQDELTDATLCVTVVSASNLQNGEALLLQALGLNSDPYVRVRCAGATRYTSTLINTADPVWAGEAPAVFQFADRVRTLCSEPLLLDVFDEDALSADDLLGSAAIGVDKLQALLAKGIEGGVREFCEPLDTQGSITVRLEVKSIAWAGWRSSTFTRYLIEEVAMPVIMRARAWLLYHRLPYDMPIFAKYRNPKCVLLTLIASSTNDLVRGLFFSLYLAAISVELDEYQLIYFILVLKGCTQPQTLSRGSRPSRPSRPSRASRARHWCSELDRHPMLWRVAARSSSRGSSHCSSSASSSGRALCSSLPVAPRVRSRAPASSL